MARGSGVNTRGIPTGARATGKSRLPPMEASHDGERLLGGGRPGLGAGEDACLERLLAGWRGGAGRQHRARKEAV